MNKLALCVVSWAFAAVVVSGGVSVALAGGPQNLGKEQPENTLRIRIPEGFDPSKAAVIVGQHGHGLGIMPAYRKKGSSEFEMPLNDESFLSRVQVLVYYPGCKLVTMEFKRGGIPYKVPVVPVLGRLRMTPLTVRLIRSDGSPIAGRSITLRQPTMAMEYFGYADGPDYSGLGGPIAKGTTDASGMLTVQVPVLGDDPAFEKLRHTQAFYVPEDWRPGFTLGENGSCAFDGGDATPSGIVSQATYGQPVTVTFVPWGHISGTMELSFLRKNGVGPSTPGVYQISFIANDERGTVRESALTNGSFNLTLKPGRYDLAISVKGKNWEKPREIPVETGFVLHEGEDKKFVLK